MPEVYAILISLLGLLAGLSWPDQAQNLVARLKFSAPVLVSEQAIVAVNFAEITNLYPRGAVSPFVTAVTCERRDTTLVSRLPTKCGPVQHSIGHVSCPACQAATIEAMDENLSEQVFEAAAQFWIEEHQRYVSAGTRVDYGCSIKALDGFLHGTILKFINIGTVREYQKYRLEAEIGASRINHETSTLKQIMDAAGLWAPIAPRFRPLPLPKKKIGKAISDEQEDKLFSVARTRKRWKIAYWCTSLMANTAADSGEIRHLRFCDVNLEGRYININDGVKTPDRVRRVPLNSTAFQQVVRIVERAEDLAGKQGYKLQPEDRILPHRAHVRGAGWDFSKPMGSWRKAWEKLRAAAGMPTLRQKDLRHHAITRMLENPAIAIETVKAIAGHNAVSKMTEQVYAHIRQQAMKDAVAALERKPARAELEIVQNREQNRT